MDKNVLPTLTVAAMMMFFLVYLVRQRFHRVRFIGMSEAAHALIIGLSRHFETKGEDIPEHVAKAVDEMKETVNKHNNYKMKCSLYENRLIGLGDAMGQACRAKARHE